MIIFIYGEDAFRSKRKLKELKGKFLRDVDLSGNSLAVIAGESCGIREINEAAAPASLFARRRMIIIENIFSNKSKDVFGQVLEYLKKKEGGADENIIILWDTATSKEKLPKYKSELFSFLVKQKYSIPEFCKLSNAAVIDWIKKECQARGGKINLRAAGTLAAVLANDLWAVDSELGKLISFKGGDEISHEDVLEMVRGQFDENIFALTDAVGGKNKALATKLLEEQLAAGVADIYLLSMVTRQFKILLQIRQAIDSGASPQSMAKALGLHPFVAQKGAGQARNFSLPALKEIFNSLVEIDYKVKSGKGEARVLLGVFLAKL